MVRMTVMARLTRAGIAECAIPKLSHEITTNSVDGKYASTRMHHSRGVARGGVRGVRTPPPPQSREKGGSGGPVQRQEEGGAKSVQEGPKLKIFLALRANNTSEITTILLKMVQLFSKTRIFSRFARYYPHEQD